MMNIGKHITLACIAAAALLAPLCASAEEHGGEGGEKELAIGDIITEHIFDSYWWHITTYGERHISIYLPVIVRSDGGGWRLFSSKRLAHGETYEGFRIAEKGEKYEGKVVGVNAAGEVYRPWDISITKNALALMINSAIMLGIFLGVARWYRRRPKNSTPSKFVCAMEMLVMDVEEDIVRASIGKDYKRYSPYLLTAFFFILINNVMGIIPIFPGGANTTGNIAITLVLALCTLVAVNLFGNREYWREIFWPDVPLLLKAPIPLMPLIEFFGVLTKPFALMIRLLANIFAGHTVILAFTLLIFITAKLGAGINAGMTVFSIVLSLVMNCLELLVAYIQAYVFTLLSAVFIGLSRPEHHVVHKK
ncbi:MAG: F0F1 ATP synthase subunit A [Prevotellaceae bacterium]|jgi:F-type H+-transporting ATPase subunit a|nr:F0F1 ATP synthase subunit A [Prevotellaceae bacterium]